MTKKLTRRRPRPRPGFVYVMGGETGDVKIGMSSDPTQRLHGVRAEYTGNFSLLATWSHYWPYGVEQEAHKLLKEHRTIGECFSVTKYDAFDAVVRAMRIIDQSPENFPVEQQLAEIKRDDPVAFMLPPAAPLSGRYLIGYVKPLKTTSYATQFQWLRVSGVPEERIYVEQSIDTNNGLDLMLRECREGDAILVWSKDVFKPNTEAITAEINAKGGSIIEANLKAKRKEVLSV